MTRILLPAVLPYMLTGVRLSVGTAWLVIVICAVVIPNTRNEHESRSPSEF